MSAGKSFHIARIAVIGLGLIGCSWVKALRARNCLQTVVGYDRNLDSMQEALRVGLVDDFSTDIASVVKDADLVIISVPILSVRQVLEDLKPGLSDHTVLTDVGSVKGSVERDVKAVFGEHFERFML